MIAAIAGMVRAGVLLSLFLDGFYHCRISGWTSCDNCCSSLIFYTCNTRSVGVCLHTSFVVVNYSITLMAFSTLDWFSSCMGIGWEESRKPGLLESPNKLLLFESITPSRLSSVCTVQFLSVAGEWYSTVLSGGPSDFWRGILGRFEWGERSQQFIWPFPSALSGDSVSCGMFEARVRQKRAENAANFGRKL